MLSGDAGGGGTIGGYSTLTSNRRRNEDSERMGQPFKSVSLLGVINPISVQASLLSNVSFLTAGRSGATAAAAAAASSRPTRLPTRASIRRRRLLRIRDRPVATRFR